jgi:iron complex transport system substrate-binding protein
MIDNQKKRSKSAHDWMEQTPLGKAEWIKLYGALFGKKKRPQYYLMELSRIIMMRNNLVASQNQQQPFCMALCIKISGMW